MELYRRLQNNKWVNTFVHGLPRRWLRHCSSTTVALHTWQVAAQWVPAEWLIRQPAEQSQAAARMADMTTKCKQVNCCCWHNTCTTTTPYRQSAEIRWQNTSTSLVRHQDTTVPSQASKPTRMLSLSTMCYVRACCPSWRFLVLLGQPHSSQLPSHWLDACAA